MTYEIKKSKKLVIGYNDGNVNIQQSVMPSNLFQSVPGFNPALVWGTDIKPEVKWRGKGATNTLTSVLPDVGGTRLWMITFPPDSVMEKTGFDPEAAGEEYLKKLPGLAELFEKDFPGMHMTNSIDYGIVISGQITIEFDNNETVVLRSGDVVVNHGLRHAWRNTTSEPALVAVIMIGADRS